MDDRVDISRGTAATTLDIISKIPCMTGTHDWVFVSAELNPIRAVDERICSRCSKLERRRVGDTAWTEYDDPHIFRNERNRVFLYGLIDTSMKANGHAPEKIKALLSELSDKDDEAYERIAPRLRVSARTH